VLEDFRFRRLGGKQEITADVRLVAATNRPPEEAIREGKLREDLYYRLNVFRIELPPLRDRLDDIPLIVTAMIEKLNQKHGTRVTHLDPDATSALLAHRWVGNVRELRNTIERAVIISHEGPLLRSHLMLQPRSPRIGANMDQDNLNIRVGMTIEEAERILLEATLAQAKDNKRRAASMLGISSKTLHTKLKLYRGEDAGSSEPSEEELSTA